MTKRIITIIYIILIGFTQIKSQDIHFSQRFSSLTHLNPAFAGINRCGILTINYRDQWPGIPQADKTNGLSFHQYLKSAQSGIGFNIFKYSQGGNTFNLLDFDAIYAFHFQASHKIYASLALQASYYSQNLNTSKSIFSDQINLVTGIATNSLEPIINQNNKILDFSTGLILYNKIYYGGFAIHHLKKIFITKNYYILPKKFTFHLGAKYKFDLGDRHKTDFSISPNIIVIQQSKFQEINLGIYFYKDIFTLGIWSRQSFFPKFSSDALIFILGINFSTFRLGYSYDLNTSRMWKQTLGAHEISLNLRFNCKEKIKGKNTISCPTF